MGVRDERVWFSLGGWSKGRFICSVGLGFLVWGIGGWVGAFERRLCTLVVGIMMLEEGRG